MSPWHKRRLFRRSGPPKKPTDRAFRSGGSTFRPGGFPGFHPRTPSHSKILAKISACSTASSTA
jgi:hypothetical protein